MANKIGKMTASEKRKLKETVSGMNGRKKTNPSEPDIDELNNELDSHTAFREQAAESLRQEQAAQFAPIDDGSNSEQQPVNPVRKEDDFDFSNIKNDEDVDAIPDEDANPLEESVHINDYENVAPPPVNPNIPIEPERFIPPPIIVSEPIKKEPTAEEKDKAEKEKDKDSDKPEKPRINPSFDDISPSQRRKNAEKDAEAIVTTWAHWLPVIPLRMAKYNMPKLELMQMKGEIVLKTEIDPDGTTFLEFCKQNNRKAEETFAYTPEMREAIKEPLIEVLLEKGLAMTPTQRLIKVAVEQAMQFGFAAFQMMQDNKNAIKQMTDHLKEEREKGNYVAPVEEERKVESAPVKETRKESPSEPIQQNTTAGDRMEITDVIDIKDNSITIEEIIPED